MWIDLLLSLKAISIVNTTTNKSSKRARERVLMNTGGAIEPIVDIDVKCGSNVERDWRISKPGVNIHLLGQIGSVMSPANDLPRVDTVYEVCFIERLGRNCGE